jgi:hypothetical protein
MLLASLAFLAWDMKLGDAWEDWCLARRQAARVRGKAFSAQENLDDMVTLMMQALNGGLKQQQQQQQQQPAEQQQEAVQDGHQPSLSQGLGARRQDDGQQPPAAAGDHAPPVSQQQQQAPDEMVLEKRGKGWGMRDGAQSG